MPYLSFDYKNNLEISTYFTQEMLKKKFLASNLVSISSAHSLEIMKKYKKACLITFKKISAILALKKKFPLKGPVKHSTFRRLTG
jgi:hypothetical protein